MIDPRKGCLLAKRPVAWQQAKRLAAAAPPPAQPQQPATYHYTPRGDTDSFVKFFAGPGTEKHK